MSVERSLYYTCAYVACRFVRDMGCAMFSPPSAPYIPEEDLEAGFAAMKVSYSD